MFPAEFILADTKGMLAALTAATKSAAVPVPPMVTWPCPKPVRPMAVMVIELPGVNGGVEVFVTTVDPVTSVAPAENLSKRLKVEVTNGVVNLSKSFDRTYSVPTGMFLPPPAGSNAANASLSLANTGAG